MLDESGHYIINGKCRFNVIASNADGEEEDGRQLEYTAWELELPFRFECSEKGDAIEGACLELECIGAVARFAGDKLELGCEIAIACGVFGEHQINEVCVISLGESADQRKKGFTVCYIGEGDSLWSISKKYRARLDHTAEENGISPTLTADSKETLLGVKYMIV